MKKLLKLMIALVFVVALSWTGLALADNTGNVTQDGDSNYAKIDQTGSGNTANITQDCVGNIGPSSEGHSTLVEQKGTDNLATIRQVGDEISANQANYYHTFKDYGLWKYGTKGVLQKGDDNVVTIDSLGHQNMQRVIQVGNRNNADILQDPDTGGVSYWNLLGAEIEQRGDNNIAKAEQHGYSLGLNLVQLGSRNDAKVYQNGIRNTAEVFQEGDDNIENPVTCVVWDHQGWIQYQNGNDNAVRLGILGSTNQTAQWQNGDNNTADIDIWGDFNNAEQVQLGNDNFASIEIHGSFNTAGQYQQNDGHSSTITVNGSNNYACVVQN